MIVGGLDLAPTRPLALEHRVLKAIREFTRETGRPPVYSDFRRRSELPDPSTVWRRFGSVETAIGRALEPNRE
ncbi:MAG: hypothetical protein LC674_05155 [Actinobacteria bacterium]|nr:hypothetical protein [Actinomycetota bacterium]